VLIALYVPIGSDLSQVFTQTASLRFGCREARECFGILERGCWGGRVVLHLGVPGVKERGFHISALYSPFETWPTSRECRLMARSEP
jgi:hypothetical protein